MSSGCYNPLGINNNSLNVETLKTIYLAGLPLLYCDICLAMVNKLVVVGFFKNVD